MSNNKSVTVESIRDWIEKQTKALEAEHDDVEKYRLSEIIHHVEINKNYWANKISKDEFEYTFHCSICGKPEHSGWISGVKEEIKESGLCHSCLHWQKKEREYLSTGSIESARCVYRGSKNNLMIIDGVLYSDAGNNPNASSDLLGFGGQVFKIENIETGEIALTNNLWKGGEIPKKYRLSSMPNTHRFIKDQSCHQKPNTKETL